MATPNRDPELEMRCPQGYARRVSTRTQGRVAFALTAAAALWAAAMVPGAALTSGYAIETHVDDSERGVYSHTSSQSLLEHEGGGVLVMLSIPLLMTLVVWFALHRSCTRGRGSTLAWSLIALLGTLAMLASASIGGYFLPTVALLVVAAALTPRPHPL